MSPRAAEAQLARTMSGGDLFAPKGGFSCPAFNSLPESLDFDLSDAIPTKVGVVLYDGLELSPLAASYQIPHLGGTVRSPLARVNKTVADFPRGWITDEAQAVPCQARPDHSEHSEHRPAMQHQQRQRQTDVAAPKKGDEADYTTPTTAAPEVCQSGSMLRTTSQMTTPDTERTTIARQNGRVHKQKQSSAACSNPKTDENNPSKQTGNNNDSEESIWDRAFYAGRRMLESTKRARPVAVPHMPTPLVVATREVKRQKKRRVVKKDPNKPKPKPWSTSELELFRQLVKIEGPNNWAAKAEKLGTSRSAKSLHTRWLREEGRIVDRPRGVVAMRQHEAQAPRAAQ